MIYGDGFVKGEEQGAVGYLIGEENRGLACMFTMMNNARLLVGIQGVGVAEAAYQQALAYAKERKQGRAVGADPKQGMSPIIEHPDVQRMLLTMKALTQIARSITYSCAHAIDMSHATDDADRQFWSDRAGLLTPLAKASRPMQAWTLLRSASRFTAAWALSRKPAPPNCCVMPGLPRSTKAPTAFRPSTSWRASCRLGMVSISRASLQNCRTTPTRPPHPIVRNSAKLALAFPRPSMRPAKRPTGCRKRLQKGSLKQRLPGPRLISGFCRSFPAVPILRVQHL